MQNQELTWKKETIALFDTLPRSVKLKHISQATGLSLAWISDFTKGKITEPSVDKVEKLNRYLINFKK